MTEPNYPPNRQKDKLEDKRVEKVIQGAATERKQTLGRKVAATFTGDDANTVGNYLLFDVFIPAAKSMLSDLVSQGIERLLFGTDRRNRPGGGTMGSRGVTYTNYTVAPSQGRPQGMSARDRSQHNFRQIVLETRGDAEGVRDRLFDLVNQFGVATVGDLYDLCGMSSSFTDSKWGWTNLSNVRIERVSSGYVIDLPPTDPIT